MSKITTNCCNCGAVMEYSKQNYGGLYKCPYCGTEHHIDLLGRIEEYKIKFMFQGCLIEAYLNSYSMEPQCIESYGNIDGYSNVIAGPPIMNFEFTSYSIKKVED